MFEIHFDGGTRHNVVGIYDEELSFFDSRVFKTIMTNNQLEYTALLHAIKYADAKYPFLQGVVFVGDSELIIKQMKGEYKVREEVLAQLNQLVREEILKITGKEATPEMFKWVPRHNNLAGVELEKLG